MALDPRIETVRQQFGLMQEDFWQIKQNNQWVCKHAALEIVATKANVVWSAPQIIEADTGNGIAVLAVTGKLGDRVEWSTGEASPKNNKNGYPWAMAEKRAKDRVILKLVGIHGLVYSEDEADDFKAPPAPQSGQTQEKKPASSAQQKRHIETIVSELIDCRTPRDVKKLLDAWAETAEGEGWSADYWNEARRQFARRKHELEANETNSEAA